MPQYVFPLAADVEGLLKSSSYWPQDAFKQNYARLQCSIGADAAAAEWEKLTGWHPFVAPENSTARTFREIDSRGFVDFRGGAVRVDSVTQGGNVLAVGTGYLEVPENAASQKETITGIQVGGRYGSYYSNLYENPIVVTARWGCVCEVPGDVWQAVLQKAALIALTQIENLQSIASISEDGFVKAYDVVGIVTQKDLVTIWGKDFTMLAGRWQRVVL